MISITSPTNSTGSLAPRWVCLRPGKGERRRKLPGPLEVKKRFLPPEQSTVAAELPVLVDHAVAGNENGDSIQPVRSSDRSLRVGHTHRVGEVFVGPGFSIRNPLQCGPHALLERGARRHEWQGELPELPRKIGFQLVAQLVEMRGVAGDDRAVESAANGLDLSREHTAIGEFEKTNSLGRGAGHERAERTLDPGADHAIAAAAASRRLLRMCGRTRPGSRCETRIRFPWPPRQVVRPGATAGMLRSGAAPGRTHGMSCRSVSGNTVEPGQARDPPCGGPHP